MITHRANRVQTGFRLDAVVLSRVKEAARLKHVSINEFVNETLKEATCDIESEEEREVSRKLTQEFIDQFCGAWVGEETTEKILEAGKSIKGVRKVYAL